MLVTHLFFIFFVLWVQKLTIRRPGDRTGMQCVSDFQTNWHLERVPGE